MILSECILLNAPKEYVRQALINYLVNICIIKGINVNRKQMSINKQSEKVRSCYF